MIDLGNEENGFNTFKISNQEIELDIFEVFAKFIEFGQARGLQGITTEIVPDVVELLKTYGFKKVSQFNAIKLIKELSTLCVELKKNI